MDAGRARVRHMRNNPTDAERALWRRLSRRQVSDCKFRRQATIGRYVADFACFEQRLIVEVDGGQHEAQSERDDERTAWFRWQGFRVLRFRNHQVLAELENVIESIHRELA
jgi:very-short-patch-repair endonuclease